MQIPTTVKTNVSAILETKTSQEQSTENKIYFCGYHENIKLYECEKCDYKTENKSNFVRHLKSNKHNLSEKELKEKNTKTGQKNQIDSEINEKNFMKILESIGFEKVIHSGFNGNKFDFFIKFKEEDFYRGIQFKTLRKSSNISYSAHIETKGKNWKYSEGKYPGDTLILFATPEMDIFSLIFYHELKRKITYTFRIDDKNYYNNLEIFRKEVYEKSKKSVVTSKNINEYILSKPQITEANSIERFIKRFETDLNFKSFKKANSNNNSYDAIVNNLNCQFKASSNKQDLKYHFGLYTQLQGENTPYSINDNIDVFIFEIVEEKYKNNFFIIPIRILKGFHFISDETEKGKININLPPPDYRKEENWALKFLNRFDLLNENEINKLPNPFPFDNIHKMLLDRNIKCQLDRSNNITFVNNYKVKIIQNCEYVGTSCRFKLTCTIDGDRYVKINISDGYEFIIFAFGSKYLESCYIIPIQILIIYGYIKTDTELGSNSLSVKSPDTSEKNWTSEYMNRFDLLNNPLY